MAVTLRLVLACVLFAVTLQRARAVNSSLSVLTLCTGCNATLHLSLNFSVADREFSAVYSQVFSEATRSWIRFRRPVAVTVRRSFQGIEFELRATGSFFRAWELAESSPGCLFASRGAGAVALSGCNNASSAPPRDLDFPEADGFELCCFGGASRPEGERRCLRYDYSAPLTMHRVLRLREHQFFEYSIDCEVETVQFVSGAVVDGARMTQVTNLEVVSLEWAQHAGSLLDVRVVSGGDLSPSTLPFLETRAERRAFNATPAMYATRSSCALPPGHVLRSVPSDSAEDDEAATAEDEWSAWRRTRNAWDRIAGPVALERPMPSIAWPADRLFLRTTAAAGARMLTVMVTNIPVATP